MISKAKTSNAIEHQMCKKALFPKQRQANFNHIHCDRGEGISFISPGEKNEH